MKILCNPGNIVNAKSYPYWDEFYALAKDHEVKTIIGILPEPELYDLVNWADVVISVDTFLPHYIHFYQSIHNFPRDKKVIVIFGKSDPLLFGYPEYTNLLKDRANLRPQQYKWWKDEPVDESVFVSPEELFKAIN